MLLVVVIGIGYHAPQQADGIAANAASISTDPSQDQSSIDDVVASSVAADVAETTNLPIAANVANLSVSAQINSELSESSDSTTITKPQIIQPTADGRTITSYTSVAGDTAESVAAKYGLTVNTIKWANNMTSDAITPGTSLQILPVNGITYTVQASDTVQSIATKYQADASRITVYNDLDNDTNALTAGTKLIIPDGVLPTNEQPGYVAPKPIITTAYAVGYATAPSSSSTTWRIAVGTPMYAGNGYAFGNCTAYAYDRRIELGLPVGSHWGNASTWAIAAQEDGYVVDHTPSVGAIMQNGGGAGHVAIVESILPDGDLSISEMNAYVSGGGFDIVSGRIVPAAYVAQYDYIH